MCCNVIISILTSEIQLMSKNKCGHFAAVRLLSNGCTTQSQMSEMSLYISATQKTRLKKCFGDYLLYDIFIQIRRSQM